MTARWIGSTAWVLLAISAYAVLCGLAGVSPLDTGRTIFFAVFWVYLPGRWLREILRANAGSCDAVAWAFGLFLQLLFHSLAIISGVNAIVTIAYPMIFAILTALPWDHSRPRGEASGPPMIDGWGLVVCAGSLVLLGWYRATLMDAGNVLPSDSEPVGRLWHDFGFFMGNAAASKTYVFLPDFHILGGVLRYHSLYSQLLANASMSVGSELFVLVTRCFPIAILIGLVILSYGWMRDITRSRTAGAVALSLAFLSSYIGQSSALEAGFDTTLNLLTSPSAALGLFVMLGLFTVLPVETAATFRRRAPSLFLIFFVLMGAKISFAVVAGLALAAWSVCGFGLARTREWAPALGAGFLGTVAAYAFFFLDVRHGGMAAMTTFAFPAEGLVNLTRHFPIVWLNVFFERFGAMVGRAGAVVIAAPVGFLFRYWTIVFIFVSYAWRRRRLIEGPHPSVLFLFYVGIFGVLIGLLINNENYIHFFHPGIFALSLLAAGLFGAMRTIVPRGFVVALSVLLFASALPLEGDRRFDVFQGLDDYGVPLAKANDFDLNLLRAFRFVRASSDRADVVMTDKTDLTYSSPGQHFDFHASAFTERQVVLEGYSFSLAHTLGTGLPERRAKQVRAFYGASDEAEARAILDETRVRWIIWDIRTSGPQPAWVRKLLHPVFESGPVSIYRKD